MAIKEKTKELLPKTVSETSRECLSLLLQSIGFLLARKKLARKIKPIMKSLVFVVHDGNRAHFAEI